MTTATTATADTTPTPGSGAGSDRGLGAGQRRVFEAAFAEYHPRLRHTLAARVRDWHTADELAQATFTRMWDKVAAGDVDLADRRPGFAWVMAWARRTTANHNSYNPAWMERATDPTHLTDTTHAVSADPAEIVAGRDRVSRLLAGVPDRARQALVLHVLDNLPIEQVADLTGTTPTETAAAVEQGLHRVRETLGVTPDQVRARAEINTWHAAQRELSAAAQTPQDRPTVLRTALAAAVADGTYPPGRLLPPARDLARLHAPVGATPENREHRIAARVLAGLHRTGILSGTPEAGYTVTEAGPRLAADAQPPLPARTAMARDLLAGIWAPGTQLPSRKELARRWRCTSSTLNTLLDSFVDAGALIHTPDGSYYTTPQPGTPFTPTARPHSLSPEHKAAVQAQVLAAVIDQTRATGRIPTREQIKTSHNIGGPTADRIRAQAAEATGLTARTTIAARDEDQLVAAVATQAKADGRLPTLKQITATHHVGDTTAARIRARAAHHAGLAVPEPPTRDHDAILTAVTTQTKTDGRLPTLQQIMTTHRIGNPAAVRIRNQAAHHTGLTAPTRRTRPAAAPTAETTPTTQPTADPAHDLATENGLACDLAAEPAHGLAPHDTAGALDHDQGLDTGLGLDIDIDTGPGLDLDELALDDALSL